MLGGARTSCVVTSSKDQPMKRTTVVAVGLIAASPFLVAAVDPRLQGEVQTYLEAYGRKYQELYYAASLAEWASNTKIVEGDSSNAVATKAAKEELARFTGSVHNIEKSRGYLQQRDRVSPQQVLQLEAILYAAADNPQTVPDLVKQRIAAETAQTEKLYGFDFKIDGKSVTTNEIDDMLKTETRLEARQAAWSASKEVAKGLVDGLVRLRDLRNQTVQALGYPDYFTYQVSEYGMKTDEMVQLCDQINRELRPLYRELHTYARHTLAAKYGQPVPALLPAHWLPNRWGQDWSSMVEVEGFDLDGALAGQKAVVVLDMAKNFYVSLGFPHLPRTFWSKSSLYPLPADAGYKKNNHASAWHLDLGADVRSLMSVEANAEWYETTHHELGHIYYYMSYTRPEVPVLLRRGANRAYHEAVGSLMGLAAMQEPFIAGRGLLAEGGAKPDPMQVLLKEALNYVVFIPWSSGVMTHFEHDLYARNLPREKFNERWWELVREYQGIEPPSARGPEYCDAATKTHVNDDAAQYYDYALSYVILFQLHDHIAREILEQDPHATDYYGSKAVGDFMRSILAPGASVDWRRILREKTGSDLSAAAMVRYFAPLMDYLKKENAGKQATLPDA
jgi:peptidyl-dipeptidase A